jgi:hypothetical protein
VLKNIVDKEKKSGKISLSPQRNRIMTNDFVYDMSEINEEEIFKGWELLKNEEGQEFWVNNLDCEGEEDYIPGLDDGEGWDPIMGDEEDYPETDDNWLDEFWGEEEFA